MVILMPDLVFSYTLCYSKIVYVFDLFSYPLLTQVQIYKKVIKGLGDGSAGKEHCGFDFQYPKAI